MQEFDLKDLYEKALYELDNNLYVYKNSLYLESLRIGLLIQLSALYDGTVRLSIADIPKKILRTYCTEIDSNNIIGYECNDGNIYIVGTAYTAYYGYLDKNLNLHRYLDVEDLLGIKIEYNNSIAKRFRKLKRWYILNGLLENFKKQKKIYLICNYNLGHHIWNEQPFIDFFLKYKLFELINRFEYTIDFFGISDMFKKYNIKTSEIKKRHFITKDILIHFSAVFYTKTTTERLIQYSKNIPIKLNPKNFKILIHQRRTLRIWKEQQEGLAKIINELCKKYSNLEFIIDGFSSPVYGTNRDTVPNIRKDLIYYNEWSKNIMPEAIGKIHNIIGLNCREKISYYNASDLLVMSFGTPEHYNWITEKSIILFGPSHARNLSNTLNSDAIINGLRTERILIDSKYIQEHPDLSYDLDYEIILTEIEKQIERMNSHNEVQT